MIVAAGSSTRFGGATAKQFEELGGRTVLDWSVDRLAAHESVDGVVVVLHPDELGGERVVELKRREGVRDVVAGGSERFESVRAGVRSAPDDRPFVLVHDAARPFVGDALVDRIVRATRRHGAAVPLLPVVDTVKRLVDGGIAETLDRSSLALAQTPQGARRDWLLAALDHASESGAGPTDEAGALELVGRSVASVPGEPGNRKITHRTDLDAARRGLEPAETGLRVGSGYDVHAVDAERPLYLGGVRFEGPGLAGHSDADVVLHAGMDAVLGAAGLGDIGVHFPPSDEKWRGADSVELTRLVAAMLHEAGWTIVNIDLTVLAERPKIAARSGEMRGRIAGAFGLDPSRVGVKATTLERLGALGREEGIACQAVALIRRGG